MIPVSTDSFLVRRAINSYNPGINGYLFCTQVRDCEVVGLKDLDQSQQEVRDRQVEFLNHLVSIGVSGFR